MIFLLKEHCITPSSSLQAVSSRVSCKHTEGRSQHSKVCSAQDTIGIPSCPIPLLSGPGHVFRLQCHCPPTSCWKGTSNNVSWCAGLHPAWQKHDFYFVKTPQSPDPGEKRKTPSGRYRSRTLKTRSANGTLVAKTHRAARERFRAPRERFHAPVGVIPQDGSLGDVSSH